MPSKSMLPVLLSPQNIYTSYGTLTIQPLQTYSFTSNAISRYF